MCYINIIIENEIKKILLQESFRGFNFTQFNNADNNILKYFYAKSKLPLLGYGSSRTVFGLGAGKVLKFVGNYTSADYWLKNYRKHQYKNMSPKEKTKIIVKNKSSVIESSINKGRSQNKEEVEIFTNPKIKPIVAKIYNFDSNNYNWVVSEAVKTISSLEFEKYIGVPLYILIEILHTAKQDYKYFEENMLYVLTQSYNYKLLLKVAKTNKSNLSSKEGIKKYLRKIYNSSFVESVQSAVNEGLLPVDLEVIDQWGITENGKIVIRDYGFTRESVKLYQ